MPLSQLIEEHFAAVFMNTDHFAVQVLRYVDGNQQGRGITMNAVVTWHSTQPEYDGGQATRRTGEMLVASGPRFTRRDSFVIGQDIVQINSVGPEQDGAHILGFIQRLPESKGGKPLRAGEY